MIEANFSSFHSWLLNLYIGFILKTDFKDVIITGDIEPDDRSILLIPNHFSWWDGFFAWHLNQILFKKRFHVMMLEHELAKRMFFTRVGAFSVSLNSKGVVESLNYCSQILNNPDNMLLMFPQGKLSSQHNWDLKFRKGVERILNQSPNTRVIFAACLTDYYGHRRPSLTISLKEYVGSPNLSDLQEAFNEHLKQSIVNQDNLFET
ncbi:MAG: glycerol acyltransferase [Bacteroidetes bacterium HGW-Bacteroidetes-15]|nr:MAG: glycerol acyltransferase [Bacteroidetes bacterium HGW-Bacteroidetes-15]